MTRLLAKVNKIKGAVVIASEEIIAIFLPKLSDIKLKRNNPKNVPI